MKRNIIVITGLIVLTLFLSGCQENKNTDNTENTNIEDEIDFSNFIGQWTEEGNDDVIWIFYENRSIEYVYDAGASTYHYWGNVSFINEILDISAMPYKSMRYTFEFSENNQMITLTSIYGGDQTILNKF